VTEQILASHPQVFGAGELRFVKEIILRRAETGNLETAIASLSRCSCDDFKNAGNLYLDKLRSFSGDARHITDKMPHNFMYLGFIRMILPNARIVHMRRDPMDNCLSIFKNHFIHGHLYSYDLTELGQYYRMYLGLMDYWRDLFPGVIFDFSYEQLVADPEGQIAALLAHCDLPWDDACLNFHQTRRTVKTASVAQVRRPIYQDSVKLWQRYENELQPLLEALG
jgi:hypothetical protein